MLGLAVALIGASYWWMPALLRSMTYFGVRRIEVSGTHYLTANVVVRGMALDSAANVFDDLDAIEARVAGMAGIAEARVSRRLPGTLRVAVREIEPVALAAARDGLTPVSREGKPLPYDVMQAPLDAPIVAEAAPALTEGLAQVQATDLELYGDVASARLSGRDLVLELPGGRVRLNVPVIPEVVRSISSVRRDLAEHGTAWRELDGRFKGWVVVRKGGNRESGVGNRGRAR